MSEVGAFKYAKSDDSPGFLLWQLIACWHHALADIFSAFDITQTHYAILASLRWCEQHQEWLSQSQLAEHTKIDKMTLSKALRRLEKRGLVCRIHSLSDARVLTVQLKAEGRRLIDRAIIAIEDTDDAFFKALTASELSTWKVLTNALISADKDR